MRVARNKMRGLASTISLLVLATVCAICGPSCASGEAAAQGFSLVGTGRELGRGVTNVAFCWLELPCEVESRIRANSPGHPFGIVSNTFDAAFGTVGGAFNTVERAVGGLVEIGLSPFPPYDPLMHPATPPYLTFAKASGVEKRTANEPCETDEEKVHFDRIRGPHTQTITKEMPLRQGGSVSVTNRNGNIAVSSWDKPYVGIKAEKRMKVASGIEALSILGIRLGSGRAFRTVQEAEDYFAQLQVVIEGDESHVNVATLRPRESKNNVNLSVSYEVHVPREIALTVQTRNGGISVAGVDGTVKMYSRNGGLICRDVTGSVVATTRNGAVSCENLAGSVRATTRNGGIRVVHPQPLGPTASIVCETRNAGIDLRLPADTSFDFDIIRSEHGRVSSDFAVAVTRHSSKQRIAGTVGDGGARVMLKTRNGSVSVRKL